MNPWMPVSPCGVGCVGGTMPTVGRIRRAGRLGRALVVLATAGLILAPLSTVLDTRTRESLVRWMFAAMLRAFGARLEVRGGADFGSSRGALVTVNHVSWLDIIAVNAVRPMSSVAKREIRDWPVLGSLAGRAGTVFLDRERLRALPGTVAELAGALRQGAVVSAYPEGTTWCGRVTGRFRPALFQAAIDGGVPVRPVAVRYRLTGGAPTSWPAFVGDDTLLASMRRTARLRGLVVELHVLPEIAPGRAADRRELAALAETAVRDALAPAAHPRPAEHTGHPVTV